MNVRVGARTDVGRVRQGNEDNYLSSMPLFGVADGMGGHLAGEVASETAIEAIRAAAAGDDAPTADRLREYVGEANSAVWAKAQDDPDLRGMGTTCTLLSLDGTQVHLAHVGDSRAYIFRKGELAQLTEDHTLVERMVQEGRLKPEEAQHHPQRSIITRALGVDASVEVDVQTQAVRPGDRLLLCSDGLSSMIEEGAIGETLGSDLDPQAVADRLVDLANEAGGEDNITVVVLDVVDEHAKDALRAGADSSPGRDADELAEPGGARRRSKRGWFVGIAFLTLAALAVGAYRYAVTNVLWFVGVEGDAVTIFHGFPEDVGFLSYREPAERTDLEVDELPEFVRQDVIEGHKVDSLADAHEYVENLEARAGEFASPAPEPSPEPTS